VEEHTGRIIYQHKSSPVIRQLGYWGYIVDAHLSSTASVLGSTSGNVSGFELGDLLVDGHVFLLSEDSIVGL